MCQWLLQAANAGHVHAQLCLDMMLDTGDGVPKDAVQAASWYLRAAEAGRVDAQATLAQCYILGAGVPRSMAQAVPWLRRRRWPCSVAEAYCDAAAAPPTTTTDKSVGQPAASRSY